MSPMQASRPVVTDTQEDPSAAGSIPRSSSPNRRSFSNTRTRILFTIICASTDFDDSRDDVSDEQLSSRNAQISSRCTAFCAAILSGD